MGMNVHDTPRDDTAYQNTAEQKTAARRLAERRLVNTPDDRTEVLAMIFGAS